MTESVLYYQSRGWKLGSVGLSDLCRRRDLEPPNLNENWESQEGVRMEGQPQGKKTEATEL